MQIQAALLGVRLFNCDNVYFREIDTYSWVSSTGDRPSLRVVHIEKRRKNANHSHRACNNELRIVNCKLKLLILWFNTIVNRQQN